MNFKYISEVFGTKVHVWGACEYVTHDNRTVKCFLPVKHLRDLQHVAKKITLVAQSHDGALDFFADEFDALKIFEQSVA